jgi:DNA-directed RNA polymerase specialized sigma24 family protein
MSGNEVKVILGCSASEVSRQLYLGMEMLRELLAEWEAAPK